MVANQRCSVPAASRTARWPCSTASSYRPCSRATQPRCAVNHDSSRAYPLRRLMVIASLIRVSAASQSAAPTLANADSNTAHCQQVQVPEPAQQRHQLGQHLVQRTELPEVGVGVLQPVQAGREDRLVADGLPGRGHRPPRPAERLGEPQPVAGLHGEPGQEAGLHPAIARATRRCAGRRAGTRWPRPSTRRPRHRPPSSRSARISRVRSTGPPRGGQRRPQVVERRSGRRRAPPGPGREPGTRRRSAPGRRLARRPPARVRRAPRRRPWRTGGRPARRPAAVPRPRPASPRPRRRGWPPARVHPPAARPPCGGRPCGSGPASSRRAPPAPGRWRTRSCGRPPPAAAPRRPPRSAARPAAALSRSSRPRWPGPRWRRAPHRPAAAPRWPGRPGAAGPAPPACRDSGVPRSPAASARSVSTTNRCARGSCP